MQRISKHVYNTLHGYTCVHISSVKARLKYMYNSSYIEINGKRVGPQVIPTLVTALPLEQVKVRWVRYLNIILLYDKKRKIQKYKKEKKKVENSNKRTSKRKKTKNTFYYYYLLCNFLSQRFPCASSVSQEFTGLIS